MTKKIRHYIGVLIYYKSFFDTLTDSPFEYFLTFMKSALTGPFVKAKIHTAKERGNFGPSGVRALPLAAGINEGGHYWSERRCADGV